MHYFTIEGHNNPGENMPRLVLTRDDEHIGEYAIPLEKISIGRASDNTICIAHESVSRHHARIEKCGADYQLSDCGSLNGIRINDTKVTSATIGDGDHFGVGKYQITFFADDQQLSAATTSAETTTAEIAQPVPLIHSRPTIAVQIDNTKNNDSLLIEDVVRTYAVDYPFADVATLAHLLRTSATPPVRLSPKRLSQILTRSGLDTRRKRVLDNL